MREARKSISGAPGYEITAAGKIYKVGDGVAVPVAPDEKGRVRLPISRTGVLVASVDTLRALAWGEPLLPRRVPEKAPEAAPESEPDPAEAKKAAKKAAKKRTRRKG